jgi:uncharacterized protein YmfQ (DUF2313 family)
MSTGTLRSLVAPPKSFDGNEEQYPTWKRQVKLFIRANAAQLPTDESKQLVALSHMQDGKASRWADMITEHIIAGTFGETIAIPAVAAVAATGNTPARAAVPASTRFTPATWDQFWGLADTVFNPPNTQNDAALKLDRMTQGQKSAEEFFIEFNMQADLAGYADAAFDTHKIRLCNQRLNKALVDNIHNTATLPTTWTDYQTRARALDNNFRIGRAVRAGKNTMITPPQRQQPNAQSQQRQPTRDPYAMEVDVTKVAAVNQTPSPRKKIAFTLDPDGRVIGGREERIAAGACHYCKLPGHMVKACPKLDEKEARKGAYSPLQKPANFVARNRETSIAPTASSSRVTSPVFSQASVSDYAASDSGFVADRE